MKKMNSFTKSLLAAAVAIAALASFGCKKDVPVEAQKNNADVLDGKTFYVYAADTTEEAAVGSIYFDFSFSKDSEDADGNKVNMTYTDGIYSYLDISVTKTGANTYSLTGGEQIGKLLGKTDTYHYISLEGTYNSSTENISFTIKQWKDLNDSTEDIYSYKTIKYATYELDTLKGASYGSITFATNGSFKIGDKAYSLSNSTLVAANLWRIDGDEDSILINIKSDYSYIRIMNLDGTRNTYNLVTLNSFAGKTLTCTDLKTKVTTSLVITPSTIIGGPTGSMAINNGKVTLTFYYFNIDSVKKGLYTTGGLLSTDKTKPTDATNNVVFTIVSEKKLRVVTTYNGTTTTSLYIAD